KKNVRNGGQVCRFPRTFRIPDATPRNSAAAGVDATPTPAGASRTSQAQTPAAMSVPPPTRAKAPRHPLTAASQASGAVAIREPAIPTVALSADSVPNQDGGNHTLAIFRTPTNVTVAPMPT